ncbi:unnamed protein product (macronuclear) [Paramecium tetraurelia]|uniref:Major facilitator superfamily (MFS) profile domain-containing protein n=1 Tax=Paramecium tetraurelia TaxID=5888 RepID=A0CEV5_PARTE|nr:uncharacterized protein GSPATT00037761001 [Paramecium tetraurelia]CAK69322.1 unnamed protein product [Paramecium tetraurelia]|eukprot:XP_001436719.1 hypothetical protein (macronuclear) [Paramecium tetraurelia strain d4-2]
MNQIEPSDNAPQERKVFRGVIKLYPDISHTNYFCSLCHYFVMTFIFVSVESLQPLLFNQRYGIHPKDAGMQNGYMLLIDIATKCIFAPIVGIMSDKVGRVPVLQVGIILTALSISSMGFAEDIYPQYCISRIQYAIGAITLATIPFLGDYVLDQTKGKASAINVILAAFGALFSATVITKLLTQSFSLKTTYIVVGCSFLCLGLLYTLGLKRGLHFKKERKTYKNAPLRDDLIERSICPYQNIKQIQDEDFDYIDYEKEVRALNQIKQESNCGAAMKIALLAGKNIWIFQGYVTNFLGRGDSILLTLSLQIWSQQFVEDTLNDDDAYKEASIQAQTLSGVTYAVIMVGAIFYGILFEKVSKNKLLFIMFSLTMIGCFLMNFAPNPKSPYTFIIMAILGSGMSGLYTGALYFVNKYAYTEFRGYISGLANVFSVLGILICSFVGGVLQDHWSKIAPFNLFGIMSLLGLILVIWSYYALYQSRSVK